MASIKERPGKNGITSYQIAVTLGRDINGKRITKFHTYTPAPGMTQKQIKKELECEAVLFEKKCRSGEVLDTSTRFADFTELWLERKKDIHSLSYQMRCRSLLVRVNEGIGHIKLGELRPHHLQALYANLSEPGLRRVEASAVSKNLDKTLKERKISKAAAAKLAGVSESTISDVCRGKAIKPHTAEKISGALNMPVKKLFTMSDNTEPLSAKTIMHHHRVISAILECAVKWQAIYDNPARRVEPPKVPKKEAAYLDDKQALEVINALQGAPIKWRCAVMLLMYSGMRRGELCGLTWDDIDFTAGVVHIKQSSQYLPAYGIFDKSTKNESSVRVIKLPPDMFALLHDYKEWQTNERYNCGDLWHISRKVFTQENGKPIHPDSITGWVTKFRESHNLPYFTPHSLRHTSATLLIMQGIPVKAVSARLGHANQNTTNMIYSHAIKTVDALASDVLGDILKPVAKRLG